MVEILTAFLSLSTLIHPNKNAHAAGIVHNAARAQTPLQIQHVDSLFCSLVCEVVLSFSLIVLIQEPDVLVPRY
jgi:hypothetical protein